MVTLKHKYTYLESGEIDLVAWIHTIKENPWIKSTDLIEKACTYAQSISQGLTTPYGQPCLEQGLDIAEIMLDLKLDQEAVAAAIMISSLRHTTIKDEAISHHLNHEVTKLIRGVSQMEGLESLHSNTSKSRDTLQIDRLRKLFLAMASDIRVVILKLAERICVLRAIKNIHPIERKRIADETLDIYAPLANRLGLGQLKWELEDIAFHYADPDTYKSIAKLLAERRVTRDERIKTLITDLQHAISSENISAQIYGRAKHIYSIYLKMQRKNANYQDIYDTHAVRILVTTLEECYQTLSIVHHLWAPITQEFDDYIATPKPNGYRSIHTAVIGPDGKNCEIQIRTVAMHEEAEKGVAAHWMYKEKKSVSPEYENKISFLRGLVDWHKQMTEENELPIAYEQILSDRVYILTPAGDILDLPQGATPLDCAYHLHSEIGNRCRGAKINGHIVPLTYSLQTGDHIEILTNPNGTPSRDWLKATSGYLTTSRARAKVSHWFRQQDQSQYIEMGRKILEREFPRHPINIQKISARFGYKTEDNFLASVGHGHVRASQISDVLEKERAKQQPDTPFTLHKKMESQKTGVNIAEINSLLTRIAKCCKPIPGDAIIGYITQGRGVSIHKAICKNPPKDELSAPKFIEVNWDPLQAGKYFVEIAIRAQNRDALLKEITTVLSNAKVALTHFVSNITKNNLLAISVTIQISDIQQFTQVLKEIQHVKGVIEAGRISH